MTTATSAVGVSCDQSTTAAGPRSCWHSSTRSGAREGGPSRGWARRWRRWRRAASGCCCSPPTPAGRRGSGPTAPRWPGGRGSGDAGAGRGKHQQHGWRRAAARGRPGLHLRRSGQDSRSHAANRPGAVRLRQPSRRGVHDPAGSSSRCAYRRHRTDPPTRHGDGSCAHRPRLCWPWTLPRRLRDQPKEGSTSSSPSKSATAFPTSWDDQPHIQIPPRCPRANCLPNDSCGPTARTELTDRILIFGERHLRTVLPGTAPITTGGQIEGLRLQPPRPDQPAPDLDRRRIRRRPVLGGLINEYERAD